MSGKIPQEFIDELLTRVDIVEVIDRRVPLKKAGRDFTARCPFHDERTPSFTVSPTKQFYHCFGCGANGSAIGFLMNFAHLDFRDAVEELAMSVGLDVATGEMAWHFQYTPNDSWDYDEVGVHMLYDIEIGGQMRKVVSHYGRNGFFYSLDRTDGSFIRGGKYVNDLNWTAGLDPVSGLPVDYDPSLDVQIYNPAARALRADRDTMKRACPTWHGGVAHQPLAFNPVKRIAYGVGTEGCFTQNGAAVASAGPDGNIDNRASERREYTSDLYYGSITAFDADNHEVLSKVVTDIEVRSGITATAGGLVFSALQDGWVIAYDDETLEELWRFNVGTPLKGAPVTYSIGPKQFVAVQSSGRHLHPVKYDNLETSSYLFVFALD